MKILIHWHKIFDAIKPNYIGKNKIEMHDNEVEL
jgi:hypothetical protein